MSIKILMPALSPTMTEGSLSKWLVKEGDQINAGQVIAEIETDKATMEVEAVDEGVVKALLFKEGTKSIKVNTPIAIIEDEIIYDEKKNLVGSKNFYSYHMNTTYILLNMNLFRRVVFNIF